MRNKKHKCCQCSKMATWHNTNDNRECGEYYCDDCVPRKFEPFNLEDWDLPISSNVVWWPMNAYGRDFRKVGTRERNQDSFYYAYVDHKGRAFPSDDFIEKSGGFPLTKKEKRHLINNKSAYDIASNLAVDKLFTIRDVFKIKEEVAEVFAKSRDREKIDCAEYNTFMSKLGDSIKHTVETKTFNGKEKELLNFYRRYKEEVKKCKISE